MVKFCRILALAALMVAMAAAAQASQKLNIYIDKDAFLTHDIAAADIRIANDGDVFRRAAQAAQEALHAYFGS